MSDKTEAQRLACEFRFTMPTNVMHLWALDAVAELRRLDAIEADWMALSQDQGKAEREIARLRAMVRPAPVQELVYLVEDDFGLFRITTKGDWTFYNVTVPGVKKTLIANATPPAAQSAPVQEIVALEMDGKQLTLGEALDEAIAATERTGAMRLHTVLVSAQNALYTNQHAAQRQPLTDAAPELLEALVDLLAFYPPEDTDPCVTAARAAIAKAEGKP